MSVVDQILAKSRVTVEVDGVAYVLRRITSPIAIKVVGSKALGIVRGAMKEGREASQEEQLGVVRSYLRECMVSPKSGIETDPATDTISFEDMGGVEFDLFAGLMRESGWAEQIADFPQPSEGETG